MEILISIGISSGVQILKVVAKKIGLELTKKITAGVVLLSCLAFSYLMERDILTWEMIQSFSSLFLISASCGGEAEKEYVFIPDSFII